MRRYSVGLIGGGVFASLCALGMMATPPEDGAKSDPPPSVEAETPPPAKYVGVKKCKMCHIAWYDAMMDTAKADAFDALKPGRRRAEKTRAGLDPEKDYTADSQCLKCHSVGFGEPGGYAVPAPGDKRAARRARRLEGVACESCHGPGERFVKVMQDILRSERPYDQSELRAAGLRAVGPEVCSGCHTGSAPCHEGKLEGDPLSLAKEGFHEHIAFKYRGSKDSKP